MKESLCRKHPEATKDDFRHDTKNDSYICKLCRKAIMHDNYIRNQSKIRDRIKKYRDANPERVKKWREQTTASKRNAEKSKITMKKDLKKLKMLRKLSDIINLCSRMKWKYEKSI